MSGTFPPGDPFAPVAAADDQPDLVERDAPTPEPSRAALVTSIQSGVRYARDHWRPVYEQMRRDQDFALGAQWPDSKAWNDQRRDDRYVVNVVLRHIQQRTATLYARNPTTVFRRRPRIFTQLWDGSMQSLQAAQQSLTVNPGDPNALALIQDAMLAKQKSDLLDKMGRTLKIVYDYNVSEQTYPFKGMMKALVRRAIVNGVGYVKIGFQRVTTRDPSSARPVADMRERIDTAQQMAEDVADDQVPTGSAMIENLRLTTHGLAQEKTIVLRESLVFDYPDSFAIIPDIRCRDLRHFAGATRVTEQYLLTREQVQQIYGVDVGTGSVAYRRFGLNDPSMATPSFFNYAPSGGTFNEMGAQDLAFVCVWETYDRTTGLVYTTCDGYSDFLMEPSPPDVKTSRFWPWFAYTLNESYHADSPYTVSDVSLLRDMQLDINRARQGIREHRHAARPKTLVANGALDDEDKQKLFNHPANAVIELNGLQPGQDAKNLLFPWEGPGIDQNLYQTADAMQDIMRVVGMQSANLGPTSGATATESSIAESSRVTDVDAAMDDMDELLSQIAQTGAEILLLNVAVETAQKIAGMGAVWPQASALDVAEEIWLEVEAGSSGRPNKAQEIQNMTQLAPLLLQLPGVNPEWLVRQMMSRLDDDANLDDALLSGMPSIQALNSAMGSAGKEPPGQPGPPGQPSQGGPPQAQGPAGRMNGAQPPGNGGMGPRTPLPRPNGPPPGGGVMTR